MRTGRIVRLALILAGGWVASTGAAEVTYTLGDVDFANPERGFFITDGHDPAHGSTDPPDLDRLLDVRQRGISMVRMYYNLGAYRDKPLG
jgi:hypothetical protein